MRFNIVPYDQNTVRHSSLLKTHKVGIIGNFVFPYLRFPPLFDYHDVSKCEIKPRGCQRITFHMY